jgi:hypothetical protein
LSAERLFAAAGTATGAGAPGAGAPALSRDGGGLVAGPGVWACGPLATATMVATEEAGGTGATAEAGGGGATGSLTVATG